MNSITGIALTGLTAASKQLNTSATNIVNANTVGSLDPGEQQPYTPVEASKTSNASGGVESRIVARDTSFVPSFDPNSPFADENGLVNAPNINLAEELTNAKLAELNYKASATLIKTDKELFEELVSAVNKDA